MPIKKVQLKVMTQNELAKIAKVSRKTVSRALTGHADVKVESRRRIMEIAKRYNYRPSAAANTMRTGKSRSIALLCSSRTRVLPETLDGIMDALNTRGFSLTLAKLPTVDSEEIKAIPRILKEHSVDGLLVNYLVDIPLQIADVLEHQFVPAIWLNVEQEFNCVHPNDYEAGRCLAEHLIQSGCQKIFFMRNMTTHHYSEEQHYNGYIDSMLRHRLKPVRLEKYDKSNYDCLKPVFESATRDKKTPTGLITFDISGIHAIGYLANQYGVSITERLRLATFLHEKQKTHAAIPFDYLVSCQYAVGYRAVEIICDMISNGIRRVEEQVLPFTDDFKIFSNLSTGGKQWERKT
jgi:LacI family transcriptional regulator